MKKLVTFILGMSAMFSVAGCNNPAGTGGHSYNFKYPTADHAVWWEMHENRIREEPYISQREGYLYINVNLDLEDIGFLGINDYFGLITAAGYTMYENTPVKDPDDWVKAETPILLTRFDLYTDPFEGPFSVQYHHSYTIELSGAYKNATRPYQLAISFIHQEM